MKSEGNFEKKWRIENPLKLKRTLVFVAADIFTILFGYFFALFLRFDFSFSSIEPQFIEGYLKSIALWAAMAVIVFYFFRLYSSIWSYVGSSEFFLILGAYAVLFFLSLIYKLVTDLHMPRSYYVLGIFICFCLTVASRFSYRFLRRWLHRSDRRLLPRERVMVIGAGAAAETLIREMKYSDKVNVRVCCAIDDNKNKSGRRIAGVLIVGNRNVICAAAERYQIDKIVFAIPSAGAAQRKAILDICKETGCKIQVLPGIYQFVDEEVSISKLRDVDLSDLLGREQVRVNSEEILSSITGKTVMVTGGGGSIGSELCRQIACSNPARLIIFDIYENNAYSIQQELLRRMPEIALTVLIGSIRDEQRVRAVMEEYRPDIVFHAAAHKHVPLMEDSPDEAIKNNTIGTWKCALAAAAYGVKKFVLISTDKAVNPTNIMGASKRMCEMVVQMMDRQTPDTDFVAVRFGNVLGSSGSVVPLFREQIAAGGPVTVTDKNITRFFMTIPEAVSLVLQAAYYAKGGEIFVLDMGEPVKIDDMARNLIRLSGFVPDEDIQIVYTGLRPGEKLYEEMLMDEEGLTDTANSLIHIGHPIAMDDAWFEEKLAELDQLSRNGSARLRELAAEIVPTYRYKKEDGGGRQMPAAQ